MDLWPGSQRSRSSRPIDHPGTFVVHRHMLDHEDHEVMPPFQVVG
jgi:FtsP/CotA-like multicopper oxidase with cupredoxin domain